MVECVAAKSRVEVSFVLPADHPGQPIGVAGDFNDWDWDRTPMVLRDGRLVATVTLAAGRTYQFRYRSASGTWFNDEHADDYVPNEFGGANCLIDLT